MHSEVVLVFGGLPAHSKNPALAVDLSYSWPVAWSQILGSFSTLLDMTVMQHTRSSFERQASPRPPHFKPASLVADAAGNHAGFGFGSQALRKGPLSMVLAWALPDFSNLLTVVCPVLWHSISPGNVQVLTTGSWPTPAAVKCTLPRELEACCDDFRSFYLHTHSGRKLAWQTNMGHAGIPQRSHVHRLCSNGRILCAARAGTAGKMRTPPSACGLSHGIGYS